jgi:hypothetical protein
MDDRGNLLSRLQWSGVVRVWDIQERKKVRIGEEDKPYWVIKDEYGATFLTWEPLLKNSLCIGERYACKGEIKIGKGGVFLILKIAETMETIKEQTLG